MKKPTHLPKQIKIITIPSLNKIPGEAHARLKSCVPLSPKKAENPVKTVSPKGATQGFLRVVKGVKVQLVPIKITHGPNGMILTPMEGDLANQAADETALRPIPNSDKYKGLPIFGPSAEEQWTGISGNDEIVSALLRTPLKENDISDFEKVFERTDDHIWKREDITYPTKHRPVFQTPHDSTFDFRQWSAAEERIIRKRYNCQECSVLVDKLTFSSHKPVNLNKALQAQLYCGFDYLSDDSSEDDLSEVSPVDEMSGNNGQVLYDSALGCEEICIGKATNELYIPVRGIKLNSDDEDEESITERLSSCSEDDDDYTLDREGERTMDVKNGCVNSAVDPFVDHSYHLNDSEDDILGVNCSADELFDENLEIFDIDHENSGENNASKEEDENLMDEADICRSVLLDYMDVEPNGESNAEAMSEINDSEETQIDEECLSDPVEIHDQSAVDSNYKRDDEISATTYESEELSDCEMDELPVSTGYEPIECDSPKDAVETSPIVITPIADEDCEEFPLEEMNSYQGVSPPVQNLNFSFINDNVVGEVNIKTEGEETSQESPEVSVSNNSVINVNETDDLTDTHLEDENVLKVPKTPKVSKKKKRRSSSSDSVEGKEVFEIKLPEDFRHMPIFHNYSLLPDSIKFSKPSKRMKRSGNKRSTKVSRIETTAEAEEPNATWLVNKSTKSIMLKMKNKPSLLFRVSSGNKLLNVDSGSKDNSSNLPTVSNVPTQVSVSASKVATSGKLNSRVCPNEIPSSSPSSTPVKSVVKMTSLLTGSSILASRSPGSNVPASIALSSSVSVSRAPSSDVSVSRESSSSASVSRAPSSSVSVSRTTRSCSSVSGTLGSRPTVASLLKSNALKRKAVSPSVSAPIKKVFISKTSGSGVIVSRSLTIISGTSLLTTTTAIKSATPSLTTSTMGANVVLSSVKKDFIQKHKEPKLLSLLKPLNLKPSTDVEPKKELTMAGLPVSKSTGRFQHRSATQTADSRPAIDISNVKKEVNDPNLDDPNIRRKKEPTVTYKVVASNLTKRKHNDVEASEPDLQKLTVQSKEDRIKKLKDRLKKQEEELEKIKKDREATKTLISLYESDS